MKLIAEIGSNWTTWDELIKFTNSIEFDYIKFQIWKTERFIHQSHPGYQSYQDRELPDEWKPKLVRRFGKRLMASVFDEESAWEMNELGLTNWKIASGDITHIRLIKYIARMNHPIWISTGNANEYEIKRAISTIREVNSRPITLMHCVAAYPCGLSDLALGRLDWLRKLAGGRPGAEGSVTLGWSSHVRPEVANIAAAVMMARGASELEFHVGPSSALANSPDSVVSLNGKQWRTMHTQLKQVNESEGAQPNCNRDELLWARRCESDWLRPWDR